MPDFFREADEQIAKRVSSELAAAGHIEGEDFNYRYELWECLYFGLVASVHVTETLTPAEADVAMGIGLSVWGISKAKAKKIISRPLGFAVIE